METGKWGNPIILGALGCLAIAAVNSACPSKKKDGNDKSAVSSNQESSSIEQPAAHLSTRVAGPDLDAAFEGCKATMRAFVESLHDQEAQDNDTKKANEQKLATCTAQLSDSQKSLLESLQLEATAEREDENKCIRPEEDHTADCEEALHQLQTRLSELGLMVEPSPLLFHYNEENGWADGVIAGSGIQVSVDGDRTFVVEAFWLNGAVVYKTVPVYSSNFVWNTDPEAEDFSLPRDPEQVLGEVLGGESQSQ